MAVGVFDSGLGGLTVWSALRARLPATSFTYLGDNANAPYGVRDADDIYRLTRDGVERLWQSCDLVILACNTASAVALRRIQESDLPAGKRVLGVFVPMIEVLSERQWGDSSAPRMLTAKRVGLFATPATVASRAFQRELALRALGVDVESQACVGVVEAIESGDMARARSLVFDHVAALMKKMPTIDAAVLGCTHYPWVEAAFADALGPGVPVYSQPTVVADSLADYLMRHPEFDDTAGNQRLLTTGDARAVSAQATAFLGHPMVFETLCDDR